MWKMHNEIQAVEAIYRPANRELRNGDQEQRLLCQMLTIKTKWDSKRLNCNLNIFIELIQMINQCSAQ